MTLSNAELESLWEMSRTRREGALARLERALVANPNDANILFMKARILMTASRCAEALEPLERALADSPNACIHRLHAYALSDLGQAGRAVAAAREQIACVPFEPDAYFDEATMLIAAKKTGDALAALEDALTLEPSHAPFLALQAAVFMDAGLLPQAEDLLRKSLEADPTRVSS